MQLRPVTYESKNPREKGVTFAGLIAEDIHELGLTEFVQYADDGSPDALSYSNMVALLVKAIQEQQKQIEILKAKIK
jgi:methanogenic corrinoid protein MtbC1